MEARGIEDGGGPTDDDEGLEREERVHDVEEGGDG